MNDTTREDVKITFNDGTVWVYSPEIDIWSGWIPGEDGCWYYPGEEFHKIYGL